MVQGLLDMTSWLYKCLPWGRAWPKLGRSCLRLDQILLLANLTGPYQIFNQTAFVHHHNCTITSDFSFQALDDPKATCGYLHGTEATATSPPAESWLQEEALTLLPCQVLKKP